MEIYEEVAKNSGFFNRRSKTNDTTNTKQKLMKILQKNRRYFKDIILIKEKSPHFWKNL